MFAGNCPPEIQALLNQQAMQNQLGSLQGSNNPWPHQQRLRYDEEMKEQQQSKKKKLLLLTEDEI